MLRIDSSVFVGTKIGEIAIKVREKFELHRWAETRPEFLGEISNNLIARQLLEALCLPGKAFVDVGSHIGSVIDGVNRNCKPSVVIAIEAIPTKVAVLRRKFPQAIVHSCAVGDSDGEISFFVDTKESGYSSLYPVRNDGYLREIKVPLHRLDNLLTGVNADVIKIDVEGAELPALRGCAKTIKTYAPTIMFESGPFEVGGFSKSEMWEFLQEAGYVILLPSRVAHQDPGMSLEGFLEAHIFPRRTTNYFAVHKSRREEVRARAWEIQRF